MGPAALGRAGPGWVRPRWAGPGRVPLYSAPRHRADPARHGTGSTRSVPSGRSVIPITTPLETPGNGRATPIREFAIGRSLVTVWTSPVAGASPVASGRAFPCPQALRGNAFRGPSPPGRSISSVGRGFPGGATDQSSSDDGRRCSALCPAFPRWEPWPGPAVPTASASTAASATTLATATLRSPAALTRSWSSGGCCGFTKTHLVSTDTVPRT